MHRPKEKKVQWVCVDGWLYIDWLTLTSRLSITWLVFCVAIVTRWETKEPSLPSLKTWSRSSLHTKLWWVNSARSSVCVFVSVLSVGRNYRPLTNSCPTLHGCTSCQVDVAKVMLQGVLLQCVAKGGLEESVMVHTAAVISLHCYVKGWRADHNTEH